MGSEYSKKLQDKRWRQRRAEIIDRDGECQQCGKRRTNFVVHHKWYEEGQEPWEAADEQLEALCPPCHNREHHTKRTHEAA